MSKYEPLWRRLHVDGSQTLRLTFDEIKAVLGFPIDHSFLTHKKEAAEYGYQVGKISMKEQHVTFVRIKKSRRNKVMSIIDYKKAEKELYQPKTMPSIVDVPEMTFIMVDGKGNPNTGAEYKAALEVLYGLSYGVKMSKTGSVQPEPA